MWPLVATVLSQALNGTAWLSIPAAVQYDTSRDCNINLPRRPLPGIASRIVPVVYPGSSNLTVVVQDDQYIRMLRFRGDCHQLGGEFEVNNSADFWRRPRDNGLSDAAGLRSGATVVAWTLGQDVWVTLVHQRREVLVREVPVRVNGDARYDRAGVTVAASASDDTFAVAWHSWLQDGDGWGVFARVFSMDLKPLGSEVQVNQYVPQFQWHPQLAFCGKSLWTAWQNGTDQPCAGDHTYGYGDCATGPFARHIAGDSGKASHLSNETSMDADGPIALALACGKNDDAEVWWLEKGGTEVGGDILHPSLASASATQLPASGRLLAPRAPQRKLASLGAVGASMGAREGNAEEGQVAMIATGGLVVVLNNDGQGTFSAQLVDFTAYPQPLAYHRKEVASGVHAARSLWAVGESPHDLALVFCWVGGSVIEVGESSSFTCFRREALWLIHSTSKDLGPQLAFAVAVILLFTFCLFRCCGLLRMRRMGIGPGAARELTGLRRRRASQANIRELREQLAQIPLSPSQAPQPSTTGAEDGGEGNSEATEGQSTEQNQRGTLVHPQETSSTGDLRWTSSRTAAGDVCSICQNEVAVWVALRPCGHAACRDCVLRIVEMNQRCHICRTSIEGVLPVYI